MISCKDISFSYDSKVHTLSNVMLDIADGEFLCILGGNGSGKSTLAKHLNALLVPDSGSVEVDGLDTSDPQLVYDVRSRVGMVFQNPDDQLVATLVENDIAFGPENLGVPTNELSQRVADALASVGLMGFEQHETHALSGGQKQRVAIAGALAMHPEVLILDEASSMLDPRGRHGLLKVCQELNHAGMTIVMITHFMEEAALADRVVVLDRGRIALEGTPEEILTRADELHSLNLEEPFACQLALELKRHGLDITPHVDEESVVTEIRAAMGRHIETSLCDKTAASDEAPQSSDTAPLIQFEHVYYSYEKSTRERARRRKKNAPAAQAAEWGNDPNAVWALRDISFDVHEGEMLGIAGHTGSGKSTIIQHMNGLVHPTQGRVLLQGASMAGKHVNETAKTTVGMVFQYPEHQLFANTVFEDVAFGPQNLGLSANEVTERVLEALRLVGLDADEVAQKSPFELSGGQQRRCAFAGVLAMRPRVLVLDEPVAGLDPAARTEFLQLIDDLHARGLTIVMVSHSMEDIATHCDRVLIMNKGSIVSLGTPREVFASDRDLKSIGLGLPAPQHMARLLRDVGIPLPHRRLYSTKTLAESIVALAAGGIA
uniref:energy-coupling factor transporter ATPase n=1 Tax=Collinsella bouchesdurhonensis TaxID=1907654 RepID=UPI00359C1AB6